MRAWAGAVPAKRGARFGVWSLEEERKGAIPGGQSAGAEAWNQEQQCSGDNASSAWEEQGGVGVGCQEEELGPDGLDHAANRDVTASEQDWATWGARGHGQGRGEGGEWEQVGLQEEADCGLHAGSWVAVASAVDGITVTRASPWSFQLRATPDSQREEQASHAPRLLPPLLQVGSLNGSWSLRTFPIPLRPQRETNLHAKQDASPDPTESLGFRTQDRGGMERKGSPLTSGSHSIRGQLGSWRALQEETSPTGVHTGFQWAETDQTRTTLLSHVSQTEAPSKTGSGPQSH